MIARFASPVRAAQIHQPHPSRKEYPMTHMQTMTRDEQAQATLAADTIACPNCGHGIDPHGTDPGGICGVGSAQGSDDLCPCLLSPNAIAHLLLAAEPTEAEVEAMADHLSPRPFLFVVHGQTPEEAASARLNHARAALRAAREARA